jgi:hypothetical protein
MSAESRHRDDTRTHPAPTRPPSTPAHRHRARPLRSARPASPVGRHRSRVAGAVCRRQPVSVWPVAQDDPLPGTGLLPGWLGRTLITLVTTYSTPGDRVLLVTPPRRPQAIPTGSAGVVVGLFGPDEFTGLAEASWVLTRLGRSVQTMTAAAPPDYPPADTVPTDRAPALAPHPQPSAERSAAARQSGSGPRLTPADSMQSSQSDHPPVPAPTVAAAGRGRDRIEPERGFELVVTAAHPHATEWLRESDWDRLLTPNGLAAVITYGDITGGRLTDGIPAITATLRSHGVRMWDHIALLSDPTPLGLARRGNRPNSTTPHTTSRTVRGSTDGRTVPITRTHHDLVLLVSDRWLTSPADRPVAANAGQDIGADADRQNPDGEGHSSDD